MRALSGTIFLLAATVLTGEALAASQNPVYDVPTARQKANISILAMSSSIRTDGGNQEIYLADMMMKGDAHQLAKLVDAYGATGKSIRRAILAQQHLLRMSLVRSPECDVRKEHFFLTPGEGNIFDASTRGTLTDHASENIPCFHVLHDATRLAK